MLLLVALTWLLYGLVSRWARVAWLALVFCVVVMFFGELLRFPQWVLDISPFSHLALVPAEPFAWAPALWVLATAAGVTVAGLAALRHRDLGRA